MSGVSPTEPTIKRGHKGPWRDQFYVCKYRPGSFFDAVYLHADRVWRTSTRNERGEYTGWFDSEDAARAALNAWTAVQSS